MSNIRGAARMVANMLERDRMEIRNEAAAELLNEVAANEKELECLREFCRKYQMEIAFLKSQVNDLEYKLSVITQIPADKEFK